jgi:hypothetical protein
MHEQLTAVASVPKAHPWTIYPQISLTPSIYKWHQVPMRQLHYFVMSAAIYSQWNGEHDKTHQVDKVLLIRTASVGSHLTLGCACTTLASTQRHLVACIITEKSCKYHLLIDLFAQPNSEGS